jgi:hypothetical protein
VLQRYIGTSPFEWHGDVTSLALGTAMYDLMGKVAGVPVYKLFGPKLRSWVPVGAWTVASHPAHMAECVRTYAARGFTWLKYHVSPFHDVIAQTEAMQVRGPRCRGQRAALPLAFLPLWNTAWHSCIQGCKLKCGCAGVLGP